MEMEEKKPGPVRMGSLVAKSPQDELLRQFKKKNTEGMRDVLTSNSDVDINFEYREPDQGRLLDLACMQHNHYLVEQLLKLGSNPNLIHPVRRKAPIHIAVEEGDQKCLDALLSAKGIDVNLIDSRGETALHKAAAVDMSGVLVKKLLWAGANPAITNRKNQTPSMLADTRKNTIASQLIAEHLAIHPKGENNSISHGPSEVFRLLHQRDIVGLKNLLIQSGGKELANAEDGLSTALQWAAEHGFEEAVEALLDAGADPEKTTSATSRTPLLLASRKGFYYIVAHLSRGGHDSSSGETAIHCVINGSAEAPALGDLTTERDPDRCLEHLLSFEWSSRMINQGDQKGNTPLHCAGKIGNEKMVLRLLESGAYIGRLNAFDDPALAALNPITFEKYLDSCIRTNGKLPREDGYEVSIDYSSFASSKTIESNAAGQSSRTLNETELLMYLTKSPDFRFLLRHPVVSSLSFMKWNSIRKWYFINLLMYMIFWILLTIYILSGYNYKVPEEKNSTIIEETPEIREPEFIVQYNFMRALIFLTLIPLAIREIFQMCSSRTKYFCNPENWLELILIGLAFSLLFNFMNPGLKQQLAALAILFSWTELVLLIGKHPALSTSIEMLKTVAWNFTKFLAWYSILIMAFALSFYTLFKDVEEEANLFQHPGMSLFKTVVMLTGEFEAGEIPFVQYPWTSHFVFLLFVFAIAIVLYNLLNGLAVSDTQAIRADAELVGLASRVKLVAYVEAVNPGRLVSLISKCLCSEKVGPSVWKKNLFMAAQDCQLHIYPNEDNRIELSSSPTRNIHRDLDSSECCFLRSQACGNLAMDPSVVKAIQELLNCRNNEKEDFTLQLKSLIEEYKSTLEDYKRALVSLREVS